MRWKKTRFQNLPFPITRIVLGGGGYNPWSVARCWAGVWGELNGHTIPERLPEPAEQVLRALSFHRAAGRNPPEYWFTTLADPPRPGVVRAALRRAAAAALEPLGSTMP
jgi:acetoin utilization protein AcuC